MTTLAGVLRFHLSSSFDHAADSFDAELAGADLLISPDDLATYTLPVGLLDEMDNEVLIDHVTGGRILERRAIGRADERRTYIRGVDPIERLFRAQRRARYVPQPAPEVVDSVLARLNADLASRQAQLAALANRPGWPTFPDAPDLLAERIAALQAVDRLGQQIADEEERAIPEKVGIWPAEAVARDLLVGTGLDLVWGVRPYTLHEPFDAVGTVYALLQRLVEPWNQTSPLGVDIYAAGTVVMVMPRLKTPMATRTMTVAETRAVDVELGPRRVHPLIGTVTLEGRLEPGGGEDGGVNFPPGEPPMTEPSVVTIPYNYPVTDLVGNLISLVEGSRTYRMPDRLLTKHVKRTHEKQTGGGQVIQATEETEDTEYEASRYGPKGPVNQPLPLKATKSIQTRIPNPNAGAPVDSGTTILAETAREVKDWAYDEQRFLVATTVRKYKRTVTTTTLGSTTTTVVTFPEVERIVEARTQRLPGWVEVTTTKTTLDPTTGKVTGTITLHPSDQAGFPPGGVRLPLDFNVFRMPGDEAAQQEMKPIRHVVTISTDPTAEPRSYSNANLTREDLVYLASQYAAISGLVEQPLTLSGPAIPDVLKGDVLQVTEFEDADETDIAMSPALIVSSDITYEDTERNQEFSGVLQGVMYA